MPDYEVTSINFKVIGLTRPGSEPTGSGLEPVRFGFPDLPAREADALSTHSDGRIKFYATRHDDGDDDDDDDCEFVSLHGSFTHT